MKHKMTHIQKAGVDKKGRKSSLSLTTSWHGALGGWAHLSDFRSVWELSQALSWLAHRQKVMSWLMQVSGCSDQAAVSCFKQHIGDLLANLQADTTQPFQNKQNHLGSSPCCYTKTLPLPDIKSLQKSIDVKCFTSWSLDAVSECYQNADTGMIKSSPRRDLSRKQPQILGCKSCVPKGRALEKTMLKKPTGHWANLPSCSWRSNTSLYLMSC